MTDIRDQRTSSETSSLAGVGLVQALRSLVLCALSASFVYGIVMRASQGVCAGGVSADAGFVGADGAPTDIAPRCIQLTLAPSIWVFAAFGGIVLWAMHAIIKRASTQAEALRFVRRAMIAIVVVLVASAIIGQVWFALIPVGAWDGFNTNFVFPFPFGDVTLEITPMQG